MLDPVVEDLKTNSGGADHALERLRDFWLRSCRTFALFPASFVLALSVACSRSSPTDSDWSSAASLADASNSLYSDPDAGFAVVFPFGATPTLERMTAHSAAGDLPVESHQVARGYAAYGVNVTFYRANALLGVDSEGLLHAVRDATVKAAGNARLVSERPFRLTAPDGESVPGLALELRGPRFGKEFSSFGFYKDRLYSMGAAGPADDPALSYAEYARFAASFRLTPR